MNNTVSMSLVITNLSNRLLTVIIVILIFFRPKATSWWIYINYLLFISS